ncbi:DUF2161 family putative PD-(D/E)XK-type phosphodiesterase [Neobacillus niacini]|uniref:DUF2161 domain-containing phosphodiesterase n=1 Tax=Neobacillus niacini TaxID=86668 RepID=UPI00286A3092|nr:DUF2161 family putative PD-(D/E)XK-type phosphodiesterase [Neobacillus niacini]
MIGIENRNGDSIMNEGKKLQEKDLYKPVQRYFSREGYDVYGEVKDCDMVAMKEDELAIIELKLTLSVDLLIQAAKRQRITEKVYVAIPKPKYRLNSKRWADKCHFIRRLELGLIVVSPSGKGLKADLIFHPTPFQTKKSRGQNKGKRAAILKEINGRSADFNIGGSNRTKIMTAYKENCIQIAGYLREYGPLSPKALIQMGTGDKTSSILTKNYYGWFHRIKRGTYCLSDMGIKEIIDYPELLDYYLKNKMNDDEIT